MRPIVTVSFLSRFRETGPLLIENLPKVGATKTRPSAKISACVGVLPELQLGCN